MRNKTNAKTGHCIDYKKVDTKALIDDWTLWFSEIEIFFKYNYMYVFFKDICLSLHVHNDDDQGCANKLQRTKPTYFAINEYVLMKRYYDTIKQ